MKTLQLEAHDLGRPTCPDVYIKKEWEEYDWPCAIDNGYWEWLYNWEWAMKESEYLGKRMPTDAEFSEILKTKDDMPNIAYAGYCSSGSSCYVRGASATYWSSTKSSASAWRRYFNYSYDSVTREAGAQSYAFSVRCLKTLQLEAHDLGRPTCPDVYIKKEWEEYDWPCVIDNGYWEWLYNWEWAMKESEYLGKRMPTDEEFSEILKTKSDMPNIVYAGFCSSGSSCNYRGVTALYWSSTKSSASAWRRYFFYSVDSVYRFTDAQSYAFSVRCLKD